MDLTAVLGPYAPFVAALVLLGGVWIKWREAEARCAALAAATANDNEDSLAARWKGLNQGMQDQIDHLHKVIAWQDADCQRKLDALQGTVTEQDAEIKALRRLVGRGE